MLSIYNTNKYTYRNIKNIYFSSIHPASINICNVNINTSDIHPASIKI